MQIIRHDQSPSMPAVFLVVRLVLDSADKRELIKSDKHPDAVE